MAKMSGFFCQDQYLPKLAKLTDEEVGSLFRALMKYHADGEITELDGKVGLAFDFIRDDVDQQEKAYSAKCKQASENRRKGLKQESTDDNVRQRQSTDDNGRDKYNNNITECNNNIKESSSFIGDDEAAEIQHEHDQVLTAAEDAGFKMSNTVRARLIGLYADNGLEKMLTGFNECATHGAPNIAYLEAVLKGTGRKKPQMKVLSAQQYEQRDYSDVQAELMAEQDREMEEYLKKESG